MKKLIFLSVFLALNLSTRAQNYWQELPDSTTVTTVITGDTNETWKIVNDSVLVDSTLKVEKAPKKASSNFRPELMAIGGAGYNSRENFGFIEAKLMFKALGSLRIGPYLGYTQYGSEGFSPKNALLGREFKYGLSLDSYGFWTDNLSHYFWLNTGLKNVRDHYEEKYYDSQTKTNLIFLSGGLSLSNETRTWFSHNQLMIDYQKPIGEASISATWKGKPVKSKAYDKESFRTTLESGIKRFYIGNRINFEPIIHLGYGENFGSSNSYYEYGGGIGFGYFKDWYRDIIKVKVFYRDREIGDDRLNSEVVLNLTNLVKIF